MESLIQYPRYLTEEEKYLIFSLLPQNKPGYLEYRNKIESLLVTGTRDNNSSNIFLGLKGTLPDTVSPSTPVFALGTFNFALDLIDIVIHEEIDNEIEIEIEGNVSIVSEQELISLVNYSEWSPGSRSPEKNEIVKEIFIKPTPYLLAISPEERKIWVHNIRTGVNTILPVSNFYNSLMLLKNERKPGIVLNPNLFFNNLESYNNEELVNAFILYNKYMKRFVL